MKYKNRISIIILFCIFLLAFLQVSSTAGSNKESKPAILPYPALEFSVGTSLAQLRVVPVKLKQQGYSAGIF